jgi:alanine dehydrogenase
MTDILWLSEKDVLSLLTMEDALAAVERAFAAVGGGQARMPAKVYLHFPEYNGDLRAMPAYLPEETAGARAAWAGVKVVNSHPDNPSKGLPTVAAVYVLNDPRTGMPVAIMGGGHLTDLRTGAAGGVAAKWLARKESSVVGLVGCGRQAVAQLNALRLLFPVAEIRVAGRTESEAADFCRRNQEGSSAKFVPCREVRDACAADIVVTTTPSRSPIVKSDWIRPGTHINAIGADAPGKQELETALLLRSRVFVDRSEQAFHSGEVNVPLSRGELRAEQIAGELGDVVAGKNPGRLTAEDVTIFDSTGLAVQDVAAAARVYEAALRQKRGQTLSLS